MTKAQSKSYSEMLDEGYSFVRHFGSFLIMERYHVTDDGDIITIDRVSVSPEGNVVNREM